MEATTLEELFPDKDQPATFRLTKTSETYTLFAPSVQDTVEISEKIGNAKKINEIFQTNNFKDIARLVYFLLIQEDKKKFLAADFEEIDENGELTKRRLSGPEMLMRSTTIDDVEGMAKAVIQAYSNASPKIRKALHEREKKTKMDQQTGDGSLILSQASTDTALSNSDG